MRQRSVVTLALFALCSLVLALPAHACPKSSTEANASPIVIAADEENEAVMEDLRPDEVPASREAMPPKGSSEEEHGNHEKAEDLETEEIQKDMAPDTVPSGE